MIHRAAFFYSDDGLVSSMDRVWMYRVFGTLNGLFGRVGIRKNFRKMIGIIFCPYRTVGTQSEEAYKRLIMGEGLTYRSQKRLWVQ